MLSKQKGVKIGQSKSGSWTFRQGRYQLEEPRWTEQNLSQFSYLFRSFSYFLMSFQIFTDRGPNVRV